MRGCIFGTKYLWASVWAAGAAGGGCYGRVEEQRAGRCRGTGRRHVFPVPFPPGNSANFVETIRDGNAGHLRMWNLKRASFVVPLKGMERHRCDSQFSQC
jgi:hypothetical protein